MNSLIVMSVTAALMAMVAIACTALCFAWSLPSLRRRLAGPRVSPKVGSHEVAGLTGWPYRVGSGLISTGIAACAVIAWYGFYCVLIVITLPSHAPQPDDSRVPAPVGEVR